MIPILNSARLTPSSHPLLALNRLHHELLVESFSIEPTQELLDEAIRTAAKHSAGLSKLLPIGHPLRGVSLAVLGKLLVVDELSPLTLNSSAGPPFPSSGTDRLKLAHKMLVRARDELLIGFGKENGGQVGKEVREALVRVEEELGVWKQGVRNVLEGFPQLETLISSSQFIGVSVKSWPSLLTSVCFLQSIRVRFR